MIELASFRQFNEVHVAFLDQLTQSIGIVLNTIGATMRTEELLKHRRRSPKSSRTRTRSSK